MAIRAIYVANGGSDHNNGLTELSPVRTIGRAIELARMENAVAVRLLAGSSFGPGDGIIGAKSGTPGAPFRIEKWPRMSPDPVTIYASADMRAIDIGARGLHDIFLSGLTFRPSGPVSDLVRIIGGANEGVAEIRRVTLRSCKFEGNPNTNNKARVGLNIQGVVGLRLLGVKVRDIYNGHRSQGMFLGGCSDIYMRRVEVMRCGWYPLDPSTANAQNQGVYIRAINGLGVHGVDIAGCWFGHSSSWGLAVSSDGEPVTDVKIARCVFSGGGKGLVLGAAEPGTHQSPWVRECIFDGVGHGYDGSPGIGILVEGATDALVQECHLGAETPGFRPILYNGELGKPPSSGLFEEMIRVGDLGTTTTGIGSISSTISKAKRRKPI